MKIQVLVFSIFVVLHAIPARVAVADTGPGTFVMASNGTHEEEALRDDCFSLIGIFDQTATDNAKALRLRQQAEQNCADASQTDVYRGWDQIRQALVMINAY